MRSLALAAAMALLGVGCAATLPAVQTGQSKLRERIHRAKYLGAMECAPADLASAQSAYRFAREEISDGDLARAADHVTAGLLSVDRALSVGPVCHARGAPVTNADRDPWLDGDGDSVPDAEDQCPWLLEDLDAYADGDGCPEPDNDNDSILDRDDDCPDAPEDMDGFEDEDGCAEPDNDGDNFNDDQDACPNDAETVNGVEDDDGCPDFAALHTVLDGDKLTFLKPLQFSGDTAVVLEASRPALDELAAIMTMNPQWQIRIEGHTDNRGDAEQLMKLSGERAGVVGKALLAAGVTPDRFRIVAVGGANPTTTNRTAGGRAANNRIEVYVTEGL